RRGGGELLDVRFRRGGGGRRLLVRDPRTYRMEQRSERRADDDDSHRHAEARATTARAKGWSARRGRFESGGDRRLRACAAAVAGPRLRPLARARRIARSYGGDAMRVSLSTLGGPHERRRTL